MALKSLAVFRPKLSEVCALCTFFLKNIVHRLEIENINNHANWCAQTACTDIRGTLVKKTMVEILVTYETSPLFNA